MNLAPVRALPEGINLTGSHLTDEAESSYRDQMITLTSRAANQVRSMQAGASKPLRVFIENGGCSGFQYGMSFDEPKDGDARFESEGVPMVVDPTSAEHLRGVSIDFDDGLQGKGFEIRNPSAKTTCGCGKSFN
jgi:iron-sulfur cluster assembly accessory protein